MFYSNGSLSHGIGCSFIRSPLRRELVVEMSFRVAIELDLHPWSYWLGWESHTVMTIPNQQYIPPRLEGFPTATVHYGVSLSLRRISFPFCVNQSKNQISLCSPSCSRVVVDSFSLYSPRCLSFPLWKPKPLPFLSFPPHPSFLEGLVTHSFCWILPGMDTRWSMLEVPMVMVPSPSVDHYHST